MRRRAPTPAEVARSRAEQQRREIEAAALSGHEVGAPRRQSGPAQLWSGPCSEHPSQMVDARTGRCPLCGLNPIHRLRAPLFDFGAPAEPPAPEPL